MTIFGRLWSCKLTGRRRYDSQLQLNSKLRKDPIGIDRNREHSILFATSRTIDSDRDQTCCLIDLKILDVVIVVDDDVVIVVVEHWIDAEKNKIKKFVKPYLRKKIYHECQRVNTPFLFSSLPIAIYSLSRLLCSTYLEISTLIRLMQNDSVYMTS